MGSIKNIASIREKLLSNPVENVVARKILQVALNGRPATLNYETVNPNTYDLVHTLIPSKYKGQGLGTIFAYVCIN